MLCCPVVAELLRWLWNVTVPDLMLIRQLNYRGSPLIAYLHPFIRLVIFCRLNEMIAPPFADSFS